ncbi:MAG: hypothetical protein WBQ44_18435 [Rhodococcus sp. (in: high G+C Gram-positive bacteria)]
MKHRSGNWPVRIGIGALVAGALFGIGAVTSTPRADAADAADAALGLVNAAHPGASTVAIDALDTTGAHAAAALIPSGFTAKFGYTPTIANGMLVNPNGGCSSPVPLPTEFDNACKAHDLGYDLLRFGEAADSPFLAQNRKNLDALLGRTMHRSCDDRGTLASRTACHLVAEIAATAVELNSWRQGYHAPAPEPGLPYLLAGAIGAGVLTVAVGAIPSAQLRASAVAA